MAQMLEMEKHINIKDISKTKFCYFRHLIDLINIRRNGSVYEKRQESS